MKYYEKRLKLKESVKITIGTILFAIAFITLCYYGINRFDKINNGTIQIVNQNEMIEMK